MDLVSIVVPIYNVEKFLPDCIDSILRQTYKNLEIILVDDGSNDRSREIVDHYAINDNRIKIIHKDNGGLSDARNVGISIANGKYITFIDSDDFIASNYIEYLLSLIKNNDADISVCQVQDVSEIGENQGTPLKIVDLLIDGNQECMKHFLKYKFIGTVAWRKLYKIDLFKNVRYPIGKFHEDVFTTYLLVAKADKIAVGAKALYYYRQRKDSIMNISFSPKHLDGVEGELLRFEFIQKYYPSLSKESSAGIIYAVNQCVFRMGKAHCINQKYIDYLQPIYRKYWRSYVFMNRHLKTKLFTIIGVINIKLLIRLISLLYK